MKKPNHPKTEESNHPIFAGGPCEESRLNAVALGNRVSQPAQVALMRKLRIWLATGSLLLLPSDLLAQYSLQYLTNGSVVSVTGFTGDPINVSIPSFVTSIGDEAFKDCTSLNGVTIGNSITNIGSFAFFHCNLSSVTIPSSVISIGDSAFGGSSSLTNITVNALNPNYASAAGVLFNKNLTELIQCPGDLVGSYNIPNSVTSIEADAFDGCESLTNVTIGNSVTSIGGNAFADCFGLTGVTVGNSVTSIGDYAFYRCTSLASVTIPNSVTSIGTNAFFLCYRLSNLTIPSSVTNIGGHAFDSCSGLTSVTFSNSLTSIGDFAFDGCSGLSSVTIPNSVTSIGDSAFDGCSSLTNIAVNALNPSYASSVGVLFNRNLTELIQYPGGLVGSYNVPHSVTSIGTNAFDGCSSLTSVTIPNSVTTIGGHAFNGCSSLTNVAIPGSVTIIGDGAFEGCSSLTNAYFLGDAPAGGFLAFFLPNPTTVYYLPGTRGWLADYGGAPTAFWRLPGPLILSGANGGAGFGVQNGRFGFTVSWATNVPVIVQASTNLATWSTLSTNHLTNGAFYFSDPNWANYRQRFYRATQ